MEKAGYWGLAGLVALENVFPPIPSEIILPMGGFLTGQGKLSYPFAVLAATVGSVAGAMILYEVGRRLGEERTKRFTERHGKWLLISLHDFEKASGWFERHGGKAVLIGRFVPGVRSFISVPAGIKHMSIGKFVLFTALGSAIYNAALIGLGWVLGNKWQRVSDFAGWVEAALWIILGLVVARWIVKKRRCSRKEAEANAG